MLLEHKNADNNKLMKNYFVIFKVNFTVELWAGQVFKPLVWNLLWIKLSYNIKIGLLLTELFKN